MTDRTHEKLEKVLTEKIRETFQLVSKLDNRCKTSTSGDEKVSLSKRIVGECEHFLALVGLVDDMSCEGVWVDVNAWDDKNGRQFILDAQDDAEKFLKTHRETKMKEVLNMRRPLSTGDELREEIEQLREERDKLREKVDTLQDALNHCRDYSRHKFGHFRQDIAELEAINKTLRRTTDEYKEAFHKAADERDTLRKESKRHEIKAGSLEHSVQAFRSELQRAEDERDAWRSLAKEFANKVGEMA